jgi:hypothetical protein
LFIPLFILGVPILDTLFAIIRRARGRQGVATADKGHLHHRLMNLGHGQRRSVLILWLWTAILSGSVLYPAFTDARTPLIPIGVSAIALALFTVLHPEVRRRRDPDLDDVLADDVLADDVLADVLADDVLADDVLADDEVPVVPADDLSSPGPSTSS